MARQICLREERATYGPQWLRGNVCTLGDVTPVAPGHFLLTTTPHQNAGLMRARFLESEWIDAWSTEFEVNQAMRTVAQATLANGFPARVPAASLPTATAARP
jgi:hypothetical protein